MAIKRSIRSSQLTPRRRTYALLVPMLQHQRTRSDSAIHLRPTPLARVRRVPHLCVGAVGSAGRRAGRASIPMQAANAASPQTAQNVRMIRS